jgi:hypothetical protein
VTLTFHELRQLSLAAGEHPRGLTFLSAASGLVRVGDRFYVVADDELHLGVFAVGSTAPLRLVRLFEGELPAGAKKRKAVKPDLEALLALPATAESPGGTLLALGSGSRPNRCIGALLGLDERGEPQGAARAVDLAPLYAGLATHVAALNIEGAFCEAEGDALVLLQRGAGDRANAAIRFDLAQTMAWLAGRAQAPQPRRVDSFDLGAVDGVALAFTDGAALPDGAWLFSAVAEQSDNSYDDGACRGAAIGIVDRNGTLRALHALTPTCKVEGVEASVDGDTVHLTMVTDADDPECPALLGTATLSLRATSAAVAGP